MCFFFYHSTLVRSKHISKDDCIQLKLLNCGLRVQLHENQHKYPVPNVPDFIAWRN